ncbi:MAG: hypothetical protein IRZ00_11520 [Gemmatimonadetes bacterium]|nr:hypothetical protein [Gemmatimonadota bacterium]
MRGIAEEVLEQTEALGEGAVVSAKSFLHLGSRAAVDQALSRLARGGHLLRVARGRYVRPVHTRFGTRAPEPAKIIERLAELTGETVVPSGATAANALGLTTQVPVRPVYLTSGPTRCLRLGRQVVELRHAPAWQLRAPQRPAGQALRALVWLGPQHAGAAAERLGRTLPAPERQELLAARPALPTWLARTVSEAFAPKARKRGKAARV